VFSETQPWIQYVSALPSFEKLSVPIMERKRSFHRAFKEQRLGSVTLYGEPHEGDDVLALLKAAEAARDPALSMADEIAAVADAVGSSYHVNIKREQILLFRR
jgi:hypothetical protein